MTIDDPETIRVR